MLQAYLIRLFRYLVFVLLTVLASHIGSAWGYLCSMIGGRTEYAFATFLLTIFPFLTFNGAWAAKASTAHRVIGEGERLLLFSRASGLLECWSGLADWYIPSPHTSGKPATACKDPNR